ncbi:MAG TPA: hypothetical protein DIU48_08575, partial [Acidobacteria bacterium]|nr:hypothetical protein [Acidobacteriota bacterium]
MTRRIRVCCVGAVSLAVAFGLAAMAGSAAGDEIGGVVTGVSGAEAGVWVIAETTDFDASFRKIVVTDDRGRYLVPDLPSASYEVWVRGYGVRDSAKVSAQPGDEVDLTVAEASPAEAAEIYPANYW